MFFQTRAHVCVGWMGAWKNCVGVGMTHGVSNVTVFRLLAQPNANKLTGTQPG